MSKMNKQDALDWLVQDVKVWPESGEIKRQAVPANTCWHFDPVHLVWQFYVCASVGESAFITQGEWAIEKRRIESKSQNDHNSSHIKQMKEKGMFLWSGSIPNNAESKAKMCALAEKLRAKSK